MPVIKECLVEDCPWPNNAKGYCARHYDRLRRKGDVQAHIPLPPIKECEVESCARPVASFGLCKVHDKRRRVHGDVMADVPIRVMSATGICLVDNCPRKVNAHGYCSTHYSRLRETGDVQADVPIRGKMHESPCSVEGCPNLARTRGWCHGHYHRWRKYGDPGGEAIRDTHQDASPPGHQWCPQCKEDLPFEDFASKSNAPNGLNRWCQTCVWKKHILKFYNMTWQEYAEMWMDQDGLCNTCGQPESMRDVNGKIRRLCVDHDHNHCSGETSCGECVRGLLCNVCNRSLGMLGDNSALLRSMADYLDHHKERMELQHDGSRLQVAGVD